MNRSRLLGLALLPFMLAAAPAPAGSDSPGCGLSFIRDPGIRASFERFDRNQSVGAQMVCGIHLGDLDIALPAR
jgi:hypothetical protein